MSASRHIRNEEVYLVLAWVPYLFGTSVQYKPFWFLRVLRIFKDRREKSFYERSRMAKRTSFLFLFFSFIPVSSDDDDTTQHQYREDP